MTIASRAFRSAAGKDGKVLVRCHAGCEQRDVIAALQERGLWQTTGQVSGDSPASHRRRIADEPDADALKRSEAALAIWQASQPAEGTPVADLSALARARPSGFAGPALPCRPEAPLGRHLAGDGGAGDARRGPERRSPSTAPFLPATAAAKRRSIRRR